MTGAELISELAKTGTGEGKLNLLGKAFKENAAAEKPLGVDEVLGGLEARGFNPTTIAKARTILAGKAAELAAAAEKAAKEAVEVANRPAIEQAKIVAAAATEAVKAALAEKKPAGRGPKLDKSED